MILKNNKLYLFSAIFASCFLLSFQAEQDSVYVRLNRIKALENTGYYSQALNKYKNMHKQHPKNGRIFVYYKNLCLKTGQYGTAEKLIRERLVFFPDDISLRSSLASVLYKKGEHQKAFDVWNSIIDRASRSIYTYQIVAGSMIRERLFDKAVEVFEKAKKKTGRPDIFSLSIADLYISQLSFSKAGKELSLLLVSYPDFLPFVQSRIDRIPSVSSALNPLIKQSEKAAGKHPENGALKKYLVSLYIKAGLYDKAVKTEWMIAKTEKQGGVKMLYSLAQKLYSREEYKRAFSLLTDIEKRFPDSHEMIKIIFLEAKCLEAAKENEKSALKYNKIANKFPKSVYASVSLLRKGKILMEKLNDPQKAKEAFNRLIVYYPRSRETADARLYLGECELSLGNFKKAEEAFKKLRKKYLKYDKLWVRCTYLLGRTLFFQGHAKESLKILKEFTTKPISPDGLQNPRLNDGLELYIFLSENYKKNPEQTAVLSRAEFLNFKREYSKAVSSLDSLISSWPENKVTARGMILKSDILFKQGKIKPAVKTLSLLRKRFSGTGFDEKAAEKTGAFLEKSGKTEAAVKQYEDFLETFPYSLLAGNVRERLRELKEKLR